MVAAVIRQCGNDLDSRREPHGEETLGQALQSVVTVENVARC